jgi:putative nucleotidyltransferase with HDIG domain
VAGAPTQAEIEKDLDQQLKASASEGAALAPARVSQRAESAAAKLILGEAVGVVDGLLHDVRLGKQLDPVKARPLVKALHASVLRNPGALISLCRIKAADTYTFQHSVSICALLVSFAHALGMDAATVEEAGLGGLLHDVGKMKIPNEILNKPGKLTETEFDIMKSHASISRELLAGVPGVSEMVIQIAGEHHEKMNGGGYPRGIPGAQISQIGRMTAIVDVYDALTSNRVYHKGMEPTEVLKKLLEWSGTHLDGSLVQQYIRALGIYPVGSLVRLSGGRLAIVVEQSEDLLRPMVRVVFDTAHKVQLQPRDLHLIHASEEIVDFEEPAEWGLDPAGFL